MNYMNPSGCLRIEGRLLKKHRRLSLHRSRIVFTEEEKFMNYTYIVQCADGTLYTGWTNCLSRRMKAHNEGKAGAKYTRAKRPVKLVYYEGFATKEEAMSREYRIKQLTREKKLELMKYQMIQCYKQ